MNQPARKVVVFGCGRGAEVALRYLSADSPHEVCGFTVDADYMDTDTFHGLPVVPFEEVERRFAPDGHAMFILLGYQRMNGLRAEKYRVAKQRGYSLISYVSSSNFTVEEPRIGENCFILDNQSINLDVRIGNDVVMWSGNHIGDESLVEDHVWISSRVSLAGGVVVQERAFIGVGATVGNGVTIAAGSFIGAGALITRDTVENGVYSVEDAGLTAPDAATFMRVLQASGKL